ncbi:MAG: hypothetical protein P4L93_05580 [Coriobacteriia bacterium]|nr:hypothetical protein [Coriobacteriia bacterium]
MNFVFDVIGIAVGLVLGALLGYWIGTNWEHDRRMLWVMGIGAFVLATVINFVGRVFGLEWLAIGAIGLMAGILSGVKYGGFPDVRVWEKPPRDPRS